MCERSEHIDMPVNTQRKHVSYSRKERYIQEDENKKWVLDLYKKPPYIISHQIGLLVNFWVIGAL